MSRHPSQKTLARRSMNFVVVYDGDCSAFTAIHINDLHSQLEIFAAFPTYKKAYDYAKACNDMSSELCEENP